VFATGCTVEVSAEMLMTGRLCRTVSYRLYVVSAVHIGNLATNGNSNACIMMILEVAMSQSNELQ